MCAIFRRRLRSVLTGGGLEATSIAFRGEAELIGEWWRTEEPELSLHLAAGPTIGANQLTGTRVERVCSRFFGSIWRQRGALTLFVAPVLVVAVFLPATRAGQ